MPTLTNGNFGTQMMLIALNQLKQLRKGSVAMQHEHHEVQEALSPRQKYQLTDELGELETGENVLDCETGDNPFSYYNQVNKRESSMSSEDEAAEQHSSTKHPQPSPKDHNSNIVQNGYEKVDVPDNLAVKPPINLLPTQPSVQPKKDSPKATIKMLKEGVLDILKFKSPVQAKSEAVNVSPKVERSPKEEMGGSSAQRKYQEQLEGDLVSLRNSLKGKEKKKGKIFEGREEGKVNLNKTFTPAARSRMSSEGEMEAEEMRMLVKMGFQKKKANYEMLKEWDRRRAENMALHGKMIELLQNEVDLRIKSSLQNFEYYQTFFREKARQEEKYVTSPVINTRYALQNNSLSKNVYINCSVILNSLCDENASRCLRINDFIQLIRTSILKEVTELHLAASQKELLKVREKISSLKSALKKHNSETEEKTVELGNLFKEQASSISGRCEKDFYRTQLSFLRKASQQNEVQKKLGEYCLEYYHSAVDEELKRSSVIREAMMTYSRGLKETYGLGAESLQFEQMSKHQELKLIQEYFSLEEMFDQRTIELFKLRNHIAGDITIASFTTYINNFAYDPFDSRLILLKEFHVKHITLGKGKEQTEENCYLVITVDNFLHLSFGVGRGGCCKPDITIKIAQKWLQVRGLREESVEVVRREEKRNSMMSYFWESKADKVYRIRFAKKDNKQEFMDYITKLMLDNY